MGPCAVSETPCAIDDTKNWSDSKGVMSRIRAGVKVSVSDRFRVRVRVRVRARVRVRVRPLAAADL